MFRNITIGAILILLTTAVHAVGYGDVVLKGNQRILSSLEAINGIIMFGWSTVIVIAAVQGVYFHQDAD